MKHHSRAKMRRTAGKLDLAYVTDRTDTGAVATDGDGECGTTESGTTESATTRFDQIARSTIFVDPSGRRREWLTWALGLLAGACVGYVVMLVLSFMGGPITPHQLLPLPGMPDGRSHANSPSPTISTGTTTGPGHVVSPGSVPTTSPAAGGATAKVSAPKVSVKASVGGGSTSVKLPPPLPKPPPPPPLPTPPVPLPTQLPTISVSISPPGL